MAQHHADDLIAFEDVKVVRSTAAALFCRIGRKSVWLPRGHISGRLWCTGDRGRLFIRRWVARDRSLVDAQGVPVRSPVLSLPRLPAALHVVRRIGV
jgi:hypothetical protein